MWKDIIGYENQYEINEKGEVRNKKTKKILSISKSTNGYLKVHLYKNNMLKNCYIHRLIAEMFIPNPHNYLCVNHKDGNKTNNKIDNLEWCSYSMNNKHAYNNKLKTITNKFKNSMKENGIKRRKSVLQYSLDGCLIKEWKSITEIKNTLGFSISNISRCCRNEQLIANNYIWKYKEVK